MLHCFCRPPACRPPACRPVKSLIRNGVISGMGCQVRVRYMRRVWCAVVGEGVGGNGKYCKCSSGE